MLSLLSNDLDRGEFLYFPGATGADRTLTIDNNGNLYLGSVQRVPQYTMTSTLGARYIRPVAGKWAKDPNLTCSALAVGIAATGAWLEPRLADSSVRLRPGRTDRRR